MIKRSFFQYFRWQLFLVAGLTIAGSLYEFGLIGYCIAMSFLFFYNGFHQRKLFNWLASHNSNKEPPESKGAWGQIYDRLYIDQRKNKKKRERFREQLNRMTASAQSLQNGVVMIGSRGNLQWWNQSAAKMLGLKKNDKSLLLTNYLRDPAFVKYFNDGTFSAPFTLTSPLNRNSSLEISISTFNGSERLLLVRDVSRWKYLEQMRQDFVANASHELRTPLTVLTGYLETFTDQKDLIPKPMLRGFNQMQHQCKRMNLLVEDLLVLTRLDNSVTLKTPKDVQIEPLISDICTDARELSGNKNHQLHYEVQENASLSAVETEIRSAISNLVFNAVNYTPANSNITVKWQEKNNHRIISVIDDGPGIDNEFLPRLTERFYRVDQSHNSETGGTGLGLAIVKHIMQRHNGHLDIQSELGKGSSFHLVFKIDAV